MYICTYMYIYKCINTYINIHIYRYIFKYLYVCIYTYVNIYIYIYTTDKSTELYKLLLGRNVRFCRTT